MKLRRPPIAALFLLVLLGTSMSGCTPRKGSVTLGGEAIPGSMEQICYVLQAAPPSVPTPMRETPLFAVLWRARMVGDASSHSDRCFMNASVTHVHGHPISPAPKVKAVYALQPDHSLRRLNLTPAETWRLLSVMQEGKGAAFRDDDVFKTKVLPELKTVEWPDEADFRDMPHDSYRDEDVDTVPPR